MQLPYGPTFWESDEVTGPAALPLGRVSSGWELRSAPGVHNPGTKTGTFRLGTGVLITDADGNADVSGADFAVASADEIEKRAHHQARSPSATETGRLVQRVSWGADRE